MRYTGLDLPVFEADRKLYSDKREMIIVCETEDSNTFIRRVHFNVLSGHSLIKYLEWADIELEKIAELTSGEVLGHQWGFYPRKAAPLNEFEELYYKNDNIPPEYRLAAEVNIVEHSERSLYTIDRQKFFETQQQFLYGGTNTYTDYTGPRLSDFDITQFVHGTQRPIPAGQNDQFILVDMDIVSIPGRMINT